MPPRGYVQIYTGDGKGKTTAAMGLAIRALGAGQRVLIVQFLKTGDSSEFHSLDQLGDAVVHRHYGREGFIVGQPTDEDRRLAAEGLAEARRLLIDGPFDVVILDEILVAEFFDLIPLSEILALIDDCPPETEVLMTGRKASPALIQKADLVTEMKEIKHYYTQGVPPRRGIES